MNWIQRWGVSLIVVLAPIILSLTFLVPEWQADYDRFKHIRHDNRPFGCESLGQVSSESELKLAYEKGANTTAFVGNNGAQETHAYRCDRSLEDEFFALIKPEPEFTMPKPYKRPPRRVRPKVQGSTWVAILGEEVEYRNGQRKFEVKAWTLEQRTKQMCEEYIQSIKGDAQLTACMSMEEYSKGKRPWWVELGR